MKIIICIIILKNGAHYSRYFSVTCVLVLFLFFYLFLALQKKENLNRIISRPSLNPVQSLLRHRLAIRAQRSLFTALYIIFSISLYIRWHKPRASVRGDRPPRATCASNLLSLISFSNGRYSWTGIESYSDACHADAFARGIRLHLKNCRHNRAIG